MKTKILYEDQELILCYKPAGLATQTSHIGQADVVSELKNYLKTVKKEKVPYLGVVHRLDQPVEGLLVFAKTKKTAAALSAQLGKGTLNKHYYAVICGQPMEREGTLVDKLYKSEDNRAVIVTERQDQTGNPEKYSVKEAVLQYRLLESREQLSLVDIHIDTGRFHQIRAQMAHAGMPLVGDRKYGGEESLAFGSRLGVNNVALCAYRIEFCHPISGRKMCFTEKPTGKAFSFFVFFNG